MNEVNLIGSINENPQSFQDTGHLQKEVCSLNKLKDHKNKF